MIMLSPVEFKPLTISDIWASEESGRYGLHKDLLQCFLLSNEKLDDLSSSRINWG